MNEKIIQLIQDYEGKLRLKESRIKEYIEEKNSLDGLNQKRELEYTRLYHEIISIKMFIDDLKWI